MTNPLSLRFSKLAFAFLVGSFASHSVFAAEEISVTDVPVVVNHFQGGVSTSYRATDGRFDPYGSYTSLPDGASSSSISTSFNLAYRATQLWEFDAQLPVRQSQMTTPGGSMTSTSVGGLTVGTKFHAGGWPHLTLHAAVGTPWHSSSKDVNGNPQMNLFGNDSSSTDSSGARTSGTSISVGAGVSRTLNPVRFSFDVTSTGAFAQMQDQSDAPPGYPQVSVRSGNRIQLSEGFSYLITRQWNANLSLKQLWGSETVVDGNPQMGTASRAFSTGVGASYSPSKSWRWNLEYSTLYPFYSYAVNQTYGPAVSLGMMYMNL